ncbi:hypothetical protein LCGC14_1837140, partial [marine sediment metagenome]
LYPDQKKSLKGYTNALAELSSLEVRNSKLKLNVVKDYDKDEKLYYAMVDGIDKNKQCWAIEFTDWNEWLGMKITLKSMQEYTLLDIVCHALWEMTFCGYSQKKIKKERDELNRRINENIKKEEKDKDEM